MDASGANAGSPAVSDAELAARMRDGDGAAFIAVMRGNNQRLYRLARAILKDDAEAEEAVQDGYLRAFTHFGQFKGEASLATWLARIVCNEALGRLRRRRPTIDIDEIAERGMPSFEAAASTPEQAIARKEIRETIERAIDDLPPGFRAVFMLRAIEQMSVEETAACLGLPRDTVKTRHHRANKLLRQALTRRFGPLLGGVFPFLGVRCDRIVAAVLDRLGMPVRPTTGRQRQPADRAG